LLGRKTLPTLFREEEHLEVRGHTISLLRVGRLRRHSRVPGVRRVFLLCALLPAILLAACGGGGGGGGGDALSKQEYQGKLDTTRTELSAAFGELGTQLEAALRGSGSLEDAAKEVESIQGKLRAQADELEGLTPPEGAVEANGTLAGGMQELAGDLDAFKSALESGDLGKIQSEANKIETFASGKKLQQASDDLEAAGYKFSE
jgi:hypothetical protein